jgi:hypothetical protein
MNIVDIQLRDSAVDFFAGSETIVIIGIDASARATYGEMTSVWVLGHQVSGVLQIRCLFGCDRIAIVIIEPI